MVIGSTDTTFITGRSAGYWFQSKWSEAENDQPSHESLADG